jgi:hypothetical protein
MDHHAVAAVSITGTCLDVVGSLYLAYDLLGGQDGPLRLLLPDTDAFFTAIESRINRSFLQLSGENLWPTLSKFFYSL